MTCVAVDVSSPFAARCSPELRDLGEVAAGFADGRCFVADFGDAHSPSPLTPQHSAAALCRRLKVFGAAV